MLDRRAFLGTFGLLAMPRTAGAQTPPGKAVRIGILSAGSPDSSNSALAARQAFVTRLHEGGWVVGQNLSFEPRYAEGTPDRLPELAAELGRLSVTVVLAVGTPAALAAKRAAPTIPIVILAADPVGTGLVASLGRPGGNVTGLTTQASLELVAKRLELLKSAAPKISRVALLWDSSNPAELRFRDATRGPARDLGLTILAHDSRSSTDLATALAALTLDHPDALMVAENAGNIDHRKQIVGVAERHRLPTVFGERASVESGGLMSYGTDLVDLFRRAGTYIDRILKGAKPSELPVEQPTKFELVINLKTAKALGLTIPPALLARADHVIA